MGERGRERTNLFFHQLSTNLLQTFLCTSNIFSISLPEMFCEEIKEVFWYLPLLTSFNMNKCSRKSADPSYFPGLDSQLEKRVVCALVMIWKRGFSIFRTGNAALF